MQIRTLAALMLALAGLGCGGEDDTGPTGPTPPSAALRFQEIAAGYTHTCALGVDNRAYCWGDNVHGTLGDGTREQKSVPVRVTGPSFSQISARGGHSCGLASDARAYCWGWNDEGNLGDGTLTPRESPVAVVGSARFASVTVGHAHTCGLTSDGTAYCWGDNSTGQVGTGVFGNSPRHSAPIQVATQQRFAQLMAGYYQTCGITGAGQAFCWGLNDQGQLGDGTVENRNVPVAVQGAQRFASLSLGDRFVCGIATGGGTWCWGDNRRGELGADVGLNSAAPVQVENAPAFVRVWTSYGAGTIPGTENYACGMQEGGRVSCWGGKVRDLRSGGEGGSGPTLLTGDILFRDLTLSGEFLCGLSRDRYAYCGGGNGQGQLGDGSRTHRSSMVPVEGPS